MPDEPLNEYPQQKLSWTDERVSVLRDLWLRGLTATDIAERLGGTTRNAVVGKAYRLGLPSRPSTSGIPSEDNLMFLEDAGDPVLNVLGASTDTQDLMDWRWDQQTPYLQQEVRNLLHLASDIAAGRQANRPEITCEDMARALLRLPPRRKSKSANSAAPFLPILGVARPSEAETDARIRFTGLGVLRWDSVHVLAVAAGLRSRIRSAPMPIEMPHVVAAMLLTVPGQIGLERAGLADADLEPFRSFAIAVLEGYVEALPADGRVKVARFIVDDLRKQLRVPGPRVNRASYISDQVDLDSDALHARRDARSLADLILLEAARPPLAIGVFGPWGSGKSTLLKALKDEVERQIEEEQQLVRSGQVVDDPAVRRVSNVMQIEFNAWTFADSENLWASLTSEIFEQIAAGGADGANKAAGAQLVADVAERTSEAASLLRSAQASLHESQRKIKQADEEIAAASLDQRNVMADAVSATLKDLFAAGDGADKANAKANDKSDRPKSDLDALKSALLATNDKPIGERIKEYVGASGPVTRFAWVARDYVWAHPTKLLAWFSGSVIVASILFFAFRFVADGALPWLVSFAALIGPTLAYAWPGLKAAAFLNAKIKEARKAAQNKVIAAEAHKRAADEQREAAERASQKHRTFLAKYGTIKGASVPQEAMLQYLLEDSSEIHRIRGTLGTLGTARKAFQKLNALIADKAKQDPASVQRIIVYIDDLDRCSEKQVVQILEAIHLLMAFPCFVAVAAVDARWLETALAREHQQLSGGNGPVTAADYLEKIFQIPFWIRPLTDQRSEGEDPAYARLLEELTGTWVEVEDEIDTETGTVIEVDEGKNDARQRLKAVEPRAPDLLAPVTREPLRLSPREIAFFHELGPLAARSPRALKRMINIYRLIRVSSRDVEGVLMVGDPARQVPAPLAQFALACDTGLETERVQRFVQALSGLGDHTPIVSLYKQFDGAGDDKVLAEAWRKTLSACGVAAIPASLLTRAFDITGRFAFRAPPVPPRA